MEWAKDTVTPVEAQCGSMWNWPGMGEFPSPLHAGMITAIINSSSTGLHCTAGQRICTPAIRHHHHCCGHAGCAYNYYDHRCEHAADSGSSSRRSIDRSIEQSCLIVCAAMGTESMGCWLAAIMRHDGGCCRGWATYRDERSRRANDWAIEVSRPPTAMMPVMMACGWGWCVCDPSIDRSVEVHAKKRIRTQSSVFVSRTSSTQGFLSPQKWPAGPNFGVPTTS